MKNARTIQPKTETSRPPDWKDEALCHQIGDMDDWFPATYPEDRSSRYRTLEPYHRAVAVCSICPVKSECLEHVMEFERGVLRHGIFAGLTPDQRVILQRRRSRE